MLISQKQKDQIKTFQALIEKQNKSINLFSRKQASLQINTLLEGSLVSGKFLKSFFAGQEEVLDLGSGNGFPALIYAILSPKTPFVLCEKVRKKAEFLKTAAFELELKNINILCERIENTQKVYQKIVSQAAMPPQVFLKTLETILHKKGMAYLLAPISQETQDFFKSTFEIKPCLIHKKHPKSLFQITFTPFLNQNVPHGTKKSLN